MLKIQEELGLRSTAFYREAFEKGEAQGILKGRLATIPLLRDLGLNDAAFANKLDIALADVRRVPKSDKRD